VAREATRIDSAFDDAKDRLLSYIRERYKDVFDSSHLDQLLSPLADELVNEDAIAEAANAGIDAVPEIDGQRGATPDNVVEIWVGKIRKYAREFPQRMADEISQTAYAAEAEANAAEMTAEDRFVHVITAIGAKAEAFRSDAQLYSEPPWGAGNQGYGEALDAAGVLMDWVTEDEPCDLCADLQDGNPYTLESLPMWPGDPHPNCRCHVTPDDASWGQIFGDAAA
jgi:hypothetical protein